VEGRESVGGVDGEMGRERERERDRERGKMRGERWEILGV
jgi:hypothetical protein